MRIRANPPRAARGIAALFRGESSPAADDGAILLSAVLIAYSPAPAKGGEHG